MASHALAQMLDELMGRDRNLAPTEKRDQVHWNDPEVCKHFLVEFCPHELFTNTRADLGPCTKLHDEAFRKEYNKSSKSGKMGYEDDFLRFLQGLISDVEKRIRRGHQRLALNNSQGSLSSNLNSLKDDKIKMLTERIADLVQQAEELGCEGKVEEAQGMMKLCDQLEEERRELESSKLSQQSNEPEKTMEVCQVCGALLVVGDVQQRIDEHLMGKQHAGYARIRAYVEDWKQKKNQTDEEREARLKKEREEREKEREKEREERRQREKEREKEREEREKEREEREKRRREEREKEREREKDRSKRRRSRSRDRHRRSRSRGRRSRSKSRDRHRSHRRRSRSSSRSRTRDRDSRRRSRSKERSKDKRSRSRDRRSRSKRSRSRDRSSDRKSSDKRERSSDRKSKEKESESRNEDKNKGNDRDKALPEANEETEGLSENANKENDATNDMEVQSN
ncbi:luc7-like protein 3 [Ostrea edulis]|uniref:luc7-like protein 3 n=1 Tax=Ostrea edulis TaxID=37623 RepID=UPI00209546A0|nr:luc7-like protein 3 [Ostrea edulis]XP_048760963.1 luc7-like protein 3 [Ostrea edulis]